VLSKDDIDKYLDTIPPVPNTIRLTLFHLNNNDLVQAANIAKEDKVFVAYLSEIVNKPIFGFMNDVKNVNQIFGILGLGKARQIVASYYIQLITPRDWEVFDFSNNKFQELQANLIIEWNEVLKELKIDNKNLQQSIALIPASLIVCEMMFRDIKETILLLRESKHMSFDEILYKMSGYRLFDIVLKIAKKWEFDDDIITFIKYFLQNKVVKIEKKEIVFLRLLINCEMSKPYIVNSGLNDFFDFPMNFTEEEIALFLKIRNKI